jgi:hypothetical protein
MYMVEDESSHSYEKWTDLGHSKMGWWGMPSERYGPLSNSQRDQ